jgi:hypothetical protein
VWWEYALWGLLGAAANRGVEFLDVLGRAKVWPWERRAGGPGAGPYWVAQLLHLFVGTVAAAAAAAGHIVDNGFVAFGTGIAGVLVVRKAGSYALSRLPVDEPPPPPPVQAAPSASDDPAPGDRKADHAD